jgi:hypothetical protein
MVDLLFRAQLHPRVRHTSISPSFCVLTHFSTSWPSGEMLAYDPDLDKLLPFGTLKTAGLCACSLLTNGLRDGLTYVFSSQPTIKTLPPLTSSVRSYFSYSSLGVAAGLKRRFLSAVKIFDILYLRLKHQTNGISLAHSGKFPLTVRKLLLEGGTDKKGRKIDAVVKRVENRFDFPFRREGCTEPKQVEDALYEIMKRRFVPQLSPTTRRES